MRRNYSYVVNYVRDYGRGHTEIVSQQVSKATYYREKATGQYTETKKHGGSFIIHFLKPVKNG